MSSAPAAKGTAPETGSSSGIVAVHANRFEYQGHEQIRVAPADGRRTPVAGQVRSGRSLQASLARAAAPTEWDEWKSVRDLG